MINIIKIGGSLIVGFIGGYMLKSIHEQKDFENFLADTGFQEAYLSDDDVGFVPIKAEKQTENVKNVEIGFK